MIITDESILRQISKETTLEECTDLDIFNKLEQAIKKSEVPGIGLAAIQVGIPIRAAILIAGKSIIHLMNPRIGHAQRQMKFNGEGCLSMPGVYVNTRRFSRVYIEYHAMENGKMIPCGEWFEDVYGIAMQHEIMHMDGQLMTDCEWKDQEKVGRNEPCKCGSGKKYKKCCG